MVSYISLVHECHHSFLSRKRLKVSDFEYQDFCSNISQGVYADVASLMQPSAEDRFSHGCVTSSHVSSSCCNLDEELHPNSLTEMSCQSNGTSGDITQSSSTAGSSYQGDRYYGYGPPAIASGWMYINENGQMCGPYIQHQLYEGLSTGFLPDELPVYPIVNGSLSNPVPLKYFKQFPDHVATGFAYLNTATFSTTMTPNCLITHNGDSVTHKEGHAQYSTAASVRPDMQLVSQSLVNSSGCISNQLMSNSETANCFRSCPPVLGEDACWLFEDDGGRKHGPHSLLELFSWHRCGYLHDSVMVLRLYKDNTGSGYCAERTNEQERLLRLTSSRNSQNQLTAPSQYMNKEK